MPAALILCFARTSRCAIVGSGTRKARAISAVVRPPSVRSVSATCASVASAGWQHVKMSSSRSSGKVVSSTVVLRCLAHLEQAGLRRQRAIAANAIDGPVAGCRHEPGARVGGDSVPGPALRRDRERLLRGFLGEVEIAEEADQGSEDVAPLVAEDPIEVRHHSWIGRTSTAPPMRAAGHPSPPARAPRRGRRPRSGGSRRWPP